MFRWPLGQHHRRATIGAAGLSHLPAAESAAARMAVRAGRRDHISAILKRLHWLLTRQRIAYKALVLTFRGLHYLAPKCISVLLGRYVSGRHLRSAGSMDLHVPRSNGGYGDRRFDVSAPRLWNSPPLDLKAASFLISFKRKLKTYLFLQAYGPNG